MTKSSVSTLPGKVDLDKPAKPNKSFPLGAANCGYWQKRINGRLHYFGRWGRVVNGVMTRLPGDGVTEALALYKKWREDLEAGRKPREQTDATTVADLCNHFLTYQANRVTSGEITARSFADYKSTTDRLIRVLHKERLVEDLKPADFADLRADIARTRGPVALGNEIQRVRTIFLYGLKNDLYEKEVRYGTQLERASKKVMQKLKNSQPKKLFTAADIRKLIDAAGVPLKAMLLLGINTGFGNSDCGNLPLQALDLEAGWIDFPRVKNGNPRRCPLWPETVEALKAAIADRPAARLEIQAGQKVFITKYGGPWALDTSNSPVSDETGKLLKVLGLRQRGRAFYSLRHTFASIGLQINDRSAVKSLMGHSERDILDIYDETGPSDARLKAVVDHVHGWLYGTEGGAE